MWTPDIRGHPFLLPPSTTMAKQRQIQDPHREVQQSWGDTGHTFDVRHASYLPLTMVSLPINGQLQPHVTCSRQTESPSWGSVCENVQLKQSFEAMSCSCSFSISVENVATSAFSKKQFFDIAPARSSSSGQDILRISEVRTMVFCHIHLHHWAILGVKCR